MKKRCLLTTAIALILCGITNNAGAKGPIRFGIKAGIQSQSLHASKDEVLGVFSADKDFGYQFDVVYTTGVELCQASLYDGYGGRRHDEGKSEQH